MRSANLEKPPLRPVRSDTCVVVVVDVNIPGTRGTYSEYIIAAAVAYGTYHTQYIPWNYNGVHVLIDSSMRSLEASPFYQVPGYSRVLPAPPILVTGTSSTQYSPCIWAPGTREYLGTAPGIRVPTGSPWEPRGWQLIMPQFMPPPQYLVQSNFKFKEGQPILLPFCQQFGSSRVPGYLPAVSP